MYAVIQTGGKQYRVELGTKVRVEKLEGKEGETVKLDAVLLVKDGTTSTTGSVSAKILETGLGPKLEIFKYKPKKNYRRRIGHRQPFTLIEITAIG